MRSHRTAVIALAAGLAAGAATAQPFDQEWRIDFTVDAGPFAGQTFTGMIAYDQATLEATRDRGFSFEVLLGGTDPFTIEIDLLGLGTLTDADDFVGGFVYFDGDELVGFNYIADNGTIGLQTFDLNPEVLPNTFEFFADPDFTPDGSGSYTFTRLTAPPPPPPATIDLLFTGPILDTQVQELNPDAAFGEAASINIDGNTFSGGGDDQTQALIRFEEIIGGATGQIPAGATVESATLVLSVTNPGDLVNVHTALLNWDEASTWNSVAGGLQADDAELEAAPVTSIAPLVTGRIELDVTASVQAWAAGQANLGWGLLPTGSNGLDFDSSEAPVPAPRLTVLLAGGDTRTFQQGVEGYTGTADAPISGGAPGVNFGDAIEVSVDLDDGGTETQYLVRFDDLFGVGGGQLDPASDTIIGATLTVNAFNPGNTLSLFEMLVAWDDESVTWGTFGGNGVQANGVEAAAGAVDTFSGVSGAVNIDVTGSLQSWLADPSLNEGWVMIANSTNGFDFFTADAPGTRPELRVTILDGAPSFGGCNPADVNEDGAISFGDVTAFIEAFNEGDAALVGEDGDASADTNGDGMISFGDATAFIEAFNAGCP